MTPQKCLLQIHPFLILMNQASPNFDLTFNQMTSLYPICHHLKTKKKTKTLLLTLSSYGSPLIVMIATQSTKWLIYWRLCMPMSDCELREGRLFYRNRMYIPDSSQLRLRLIRQAHSSPSGGHGRKSRNTLSSLYLPWSCAVSTTFSAELRDIAPALNPSMKSTMVYFNPCPCRLKPEKKLLWILCDWAA